MVRRAASKARGHKKLGRGAGNFSNDGEALAFELKQALHGTKWKMQRKAVSLAHVSIQDKCNGWHA